MKLNLIAEQEILDFEKEHGLELKVTERPDHLRTYNNLPRYYVSFENGEIRDGRGLIGATGNGNTVDEAIQDYCKEIGTKTLVLNAYSRGRKEIVLPRLFHTKLLNK